MGLLPWHTDHNTIFLRMQGPDRWVFSSFSFNLPFWPIFRLVNARFLGWVLVEKTWKCQRTTFCIHSCVRIFRPAYAGMFLRACVCSSIYAHTSFSLHMRAECLHTEPYSCTRIPRGRNPNLSIWTHFPSVFYLLAMLTSFFTIFASNCMSYVIFHPIVNPISLSHQSLHLIMNLISFSFYRFYLHTPAKGVPTEYWYDT